MTIEQTVEIPASRRLTLDFALPKSVPQGSAKIKVLIDSTEKKQSRFSLFRRKTVMDFFGRLKDSPAFANIDPVEYQRKLRDEWPD
ncbi:MAG: hypothetical protein Ta2A_19500 [Treponemataceae bacterium]|nr:MAG: hypothetical protein Ta2A_19500 [Treponemataceae bacterium]